MKKISIIFLALALLLLSLVTLVGCGHEGGRKVDISYGFEKLNEPISKDSPDTRKNVLLNGYNSYDYLELVIKDYEENTTETIYVHNIDEENNVDLVIFVKTERQITIGEGHTVTETTFELLKRVGSDGTFVYCKSVQIPGGEPLKSDAEIITKSDFDTAVQRIFTRVYRSEMVPDAESQITAAYKNSLSFNTGKVQTITLEFNGKHSETDSFVSVRFNYTTNKIHDVKFYSADGETLLETIEYRYPGNTVSAPEEINYDLFNLGHTCSGGTATCTTKAICDNCGKAYGEPAAHTEEIIPAVAATCTSTGLTEGKKCTACGTTTVAQTTVEALGHDHSEGAVVCKRCEAVALISTSDNIQEIINNLENGTEIVIGADIVLPAELEITKEIIINLNGKTISTTNATNGNGVFWVKEDGKLTINGEGTINGVCESEYDMAIWADGGEVVINGGTFTNVGAGEEDQYDLIYTKNGGKVVINGGKFISETPKWTLNKNDSTESIIIVTGGEFVGYNPAASDTENPQANFVADGYTVTSEVIDGVTVYTVVAAEVQE